MRDENRPVTRLAFTLDSRQVTLLFIGGVIAAAVLFSLGVMVGGRLTSVAETPGQEDLLEKLDTQERNYQDRIVDEAIEGDSAKVKLEDQAVADRKADKAEFPKEEERKEEAVAIAEKAKAADEKEKIETPKPKIETSKEKPKPKPKQEETKAKAESTRTPAPAGRVYSLQIASLPSKEQAENYIKGFKSFDSRKPFLVSAEVPGKGTWFRVKIGRFETKEQALAYQSIFEAKTRIQTILAIE